MISVLVQYGLVQWKWVLVIGDYWHIKTGEASWDKGIAGYLDIYDEDDKIIATFPRGNWKRVCKGVMSGYE